MKKIDQRMLELTIKDIDSHFRAYLPPDMRAILDDLVRVHEDLEAVEAGTMTDKGIKSMDKRLYRIWMYFKNNPLITPEGVTRDNQPAPE